MAALVFTHNPYTLEAPITWMSPVSSPTVSSSTDLIAAFAHKWAARTPNVVDTICRNGGTWGEGMRQPNHVVVSSASLSEEGGLEEEGLESIPSSVSPQQRARGGGRGRRGGRRVNRRRAAAIAAREREAAMFGFQVVPGVESCSDEDSEEMGSEGHSGSEDTVASNEY